MSRKQPWASDVRVSQPIAPTSDMPVLVDFGGAGFTAGGPAPALSEADAEEWFTPPIGPEEVPDAHRR